MEINILENPRLRQRRLEQIEPRRKRKQQLEMLNGTFECSKTNVLLYF